MSANSRRKSRLAALKALYATDVGGQTPEESLENAVRAAGLSDSARAFAERLVRGVFDNQAQIDAKIGALARGYSLERLAAVDRALLRLGMYELLFAFDVPAAVAINEAVELAKEYSTGESGSFVNGILGAVVKEKGEAI